MRLPVRLQLLTCLVLYASCAHAIMVKFGTKGGPIEPPPPEPALPPAQPFRAPAPVWEERANDNPDPNAQWRPQLFIPQPRYTQVVYTGQLPLNNAQRFVNSYIPQHQPIQAQSTQPGGYFTPSQVLSSQSLPGFGLRYFQPTYHQEQTKDTRQEYSKANAIDSNVVDRSDSASDLQWQFEKDQTRRNTRNTQEASVVPYVYQFPAYVSRHR